MADKTFRTGILITGDGSGAQRALKLTQEQIEQLTRATQRSGEQSFRMAEGWQKSLGSITSAAAKWSAAMAAAGVTATAALVKNAIDSAEATGILAGKLGITTEALSRLEYAAKLSDVSQTALEGGLKRLTLTLAAAQDPASKAAKSLEALGLSSEKLLKLPADQQLGAIADALSRVQNQSEKAALAQRLFGRAGVELLPLLAEGSQGIQTLGDELERLGGIVDGDLAERSAAFNDNLDRLSVAVRGLGFSIAEELLGPMSGLSDEIVELASKRETAEGIAAFLKLIGDTTLATVRIMSTTGNVFRFFGESLAAAFNGAAIGDRPRLEDELRDLEGRLRWFEVTAASGQQLWQADAEQIAAIALQMSRIKEYIRITDELAASQQRAQASVATAARESRDLAEFDLRTLPERRRLTQDLGASVAAAAREREQADRAARANLEIDLRTLPRRRDVPEIVAPPQDRTSWVEGARAAVADYDAFVEDVFGRTQEVVGNAFQSMEDALVQFVETGKLSFSDLVDSILRDLLRLMIQRAVIAPIADALGGFFAGFGGSSSAASGEFAMPASTRAELGLAKGGVIESPSLHRYVNQVHDTPQFFQFARGGVFAEAGPEAVMPLTRDASGRLGVQASGGGVTVEVHNYSGSEATTRETSDARGNRRIEVIVGEMIAGEMTRPGSAVNYATRTAWGLRPAMIMR